MAIDSYGEIHDSKVTSNVITVLLKANHAIADRGYGSQAFTGANN